jgi:hypothetical protein
LTSAPSAGALVCDIADVIQVEFVGTTLIVDVGFN